MSPHAPPAASLLLGYGSTCCRSRRSRAAYARGSAGQLLLLLLLLLARLSSGLRPEEVVVRKESSSLAFGIVHRRLLTFEMAIMKGWRSKECSFQRYGRIIDRQHEVPRAFGHHLQVLAIQGPYIRKPRHILTACATRTGTLIERTQTMAPKRPERAPFASPESLMDRLKTQPWLRKGPNEPHLLRPSH